MLRLNMVLKIYKFLLKHPLYKWLWCLYYLISLSSICACVIFSYFHIILRCNVFPPPPTRIVTRALSRDSNYEPNSLEIAILDR